MLFIGKNLHYFLLFITLISTDSYWLYSAAWPYGVFQGDVPDKCPVCPHHSCPAIVEPWIIFFSGYSYSIKFHITYSIFSPVPAIGKSRYIFHVSRQNALTALVHRTSSTLASITMFFELFFVQLLEKHIDTKLFLFLTYDYQMRSTAHFFGVCFPLPPNSQHNAI